MDSFTNIPDDVGYDLFRCGYWLVNITSCGEIKRDVIIYIKVHVDNEIYFFHCFTAKDLDREDAIPKKNEDLYRGLNVVVLWL